MWTIVKKIGSINSSAILLLYYARVLEALGSGNQALGIIERALRLDPDNPMLHLNASRIHLKQGQVDRAVLHWKKATGPENVASFLYWLNQPLKQWRHNQICGRLLEPDDPADKASNSSPNHSPSLNDAALVLLEQGYHREALDIFQELRQSCFNDPAILFNTGLTFSLLGQHAEALEQYRKAQALGLNSMELLNNKGYSLFCLGLYEESLACYELARSTSPTDLTVLSNLASCYYMTGRLKEANGCYKSALQVYTNDATLHNNYAVFLEGCERYDEALRYYERALTLNIVEPSIRVNRAGCLAKINRQQEALAIYDSLLKHQPQNSELWGLRGNLLNDMGRTVEAADSYRRALGMAG